MNRFRSRLLAAALAAIIIITSAVSGSVVHAQPSEAGMSTEGISVTAEVGNEMEGPEADRAEADQQTEGPMIGGEETEEDGSGEGAAQAAPSEPGEEADAPSEPGEEAAAPSEPEGEAAAPSELEEEVAAPSESEEEAAAPSESEEDEDGSGQIHGVITDAVDRPEMADPEQKVEDIPSVPDGISPAALLAAADEPDWTKGGAGTKTDVSDKVQFTQDSVHWYTYSNRDYGTYNTASYTVKLNGEEVGFSVCMDPRRSGDRVTKSDRTYEITAPMLVKAVYYGAYGPGKSTIRSITGTDDTGANNIVTHVAVAEIYARLGYAQKSKEGDGFIDTSDKLREHVRKYVKAIEDLPVPDRYYLYIVAVDDGSKQDFGFGSTELITHEASFKIVKVPNEDDKAMLAKITGNSNYSMAGARYGIYRESDTAENLRKKTPYKSLTAGSDGETDFCIVPPGTYYAVEIQAPRKGGYIMSNSVLTITLSSGEQKKIEAPENYKFVYLRIVKEPRDTAPGQPVPSLAGAVFEIYSDSKRQPASLVGTVTTGEDGMTEQLKKDTKGNYLLAQTYYVKEVTPPEGYNAVGNFSIDTTPALEADARYTLIDRTVKEPLRRAGITIYKKSQDPDVTDDNNCYGSMKGAEFGIYSDEACSQLVETVVTDEDGIAITSVSLPVADYWIKEIKAPEGFYINDEVRHISKQEMTESADRELVVTDDYKRDPAQITIEKRAAGGVKGNSLENAEFTFSYYDGYFKSESELPEQPVRSWTIKTKETGGKYAARLYDCMENGTFVSGDEFYLDGKGKPAFPLGTVTIRETRAPEGYKNDPDFGGGSKMLIGNVILNSAGDAKFTVVQGMDPAENTITVLETPETPQIRTSAVDADSRSRMMYAGDGVFRIIDTVTYKNLNKNTDYTMYGTLMDKADEKPFRDENGKEIRASAKFNTGDAMSGSVDVVFEFSHREDLIKGHVLVVKEELRADETNTDYEMIPGAVHWDPEDKEQTIFIPKIGTTLTGKENREHIVPAGTDVELVDSVTYESLIPGENYTVTGTLMDKADGRPIRYNGENVTSTASFKAEKSEGTVEITFRFHTAGFEGKSLVAFEKLTYGERTVAAHEDLSDGGQTVTIPGIETDAYDDETGKKNTLAARDRIIVDKVSYTGLIPGRIYELEGEVKIKPSDSSVSFDDAETVPSEIVAAEGRGSVSYDAEKVTFVPEGNENEPVSGILYVSFKADTSDLAGKEVVVGERLIQNGAVIAVHRDISDTRQSDRIPDGQTVSVDTSTGIKNTLAADNRVFRDTFRYEKLIPGETYRFTGKVMADAGTDAEGKICLEEIPSFMTDENGVPVENGYTEFVPEEESGTIDLFFSIDASDLADRDVTVFEKVTLNGGPVIVHEELNGTQTIYIPEGRTSVIDSETREQVSMPDEEVSIIDTMLYRNLIPGTEYTVKGRVMRKRTGEEIASKLKEASFAEGASGSVSLEDDVVTFTPEQEDGALELSFVFEASELAGEDVVVFERVYHNGAEVIVHENIDDEPQTIHFPDGGTKAADSETGSHTANADGDVTITDEVVYRNLVPGKMYVVKGTLMNKMTGRPVVSGGSSVTAQKQFVPEAPDGSVELEFTFDGKALAGNSVVAFETVTLNGREVFVHADLEDADQTVNFPEVRTTATDSKDGDHEISYKGTVTIADKVEYRNLTPGEKYRVAGVLMSRSTGEAAKAGDSGITGEAFLTPEKKDGTVRVSFTFDSSKLKEGDYVVFETLYAIDEQTGEENIAGSHRDLADAAQTISRPAPPKPPGSPGTGDHDDPLLWMAVFMTAAALAAGAVCFGKRRFTK